MGFGFEYREAALATLTRSILVVDPNELTDDIVCELCMRSWFACVPGFTRRNPRRTVPRRRARTGNA
ncbi:hypothetical protein [Candidatus Methylacidithermus pantelleriae]|uniref:Uncharacterized protein n=1 Tax=Candidatus Methylacidithermus pantelleriae TaxID=2744239 RepID=A0A8J2FP52_9BACT|nr:hypothetical protein [Candidatus Methylacidithermus pantelleriae]CAF0696215.1 hypothetical protein MPNT_20153 [Candidatus Methylacidithermus pantelleriae]